ncbi:16S rRNA (cytidine1402-2'-O)-methyltransferase [Thermonema lapsum]|uniref:16S rRNA (Cytidine1402-2'-O)-methyltransferase n=1 Tax=Thermonema lapsum TaxID=28195 RepID=A0A846MS62_9BACT|nr:SAM-dependent methyltransferase [Thermonema lapsum]NIK74097.1 16S rRNA (cytidine1402-2'-O)-methyltransferase [Thermonema lapsum]
MSTNTSGTLFLIPSALASGSEQAVTTPQVVEVLRRVRCFFVENERSARRFISALKIGVDIGALELYEWHKRSDFQSLDAPLKKLLSGTDFGIISEAGLPAVADPGAQIVAWAHRHGVAVRPLTGASSIFLTLMASGLNGQSFCFHGYLPIEKEARSRKIREIEQAARQGNAQIFMETPYRNNALLDAILKQVEENLQLCIGVNLTAADEWVFTQSVKKWKQSPPDLHKKPAIFILGKPPA